MNCSPEMQKYFDSLKKDCFAAYKHANDARAMGYDPDNIVEVNLAETLAERVVGLISLLAPQIKESNVADRIQELEKNYGSLNWRIGMIIAHEIAEQKHCAFDTDKEAIEVGIRVGFAYVTVGVVSSPMEGFIGIDIVPRRDGEGEFFRINYAGPIRNAGGTAAAVSVLIADYVRKKLGYAKYDPDAKEVLRCAAELEDYHRFVANLQYFPSKEETEFLMQNLPVEIAGDPSEKWEISNVNLKDLPRVKTNNLRSGYCLIHSACLPLKAPKLWKQLEVWGAEMGMEDWNFYKEFLELQKKMKADGKKDDSKKISPDYTYIKDIVAGRPVLGHPLQPGGFRLRYGRGRASGYSGQSINPATMIVLDNFIATGTQLKVERPGKAAAFTPCDSIDGPVVKLFDGSVVYLHTEEEARAVKTKIDEILFLGDVLINYGDFFDRAHTLIPPGYCEEWWAQEVAAVSDKYEKFTSNPFGTRPTFSEAKEIALTTNTPLHPRHTYFWTLLTDEEHNTLHKAVTHDVTKLSTEVKSLLETAGVPHTIEKDIIILESEVATALTNLYTKPLVQSKEVLTLINTSSSTILYDKAGVFIGSRMGRPEKAKMRKMKGSPHALFPIGEQGGRLRSFQAAMEVKYVHSSFPINKCEKCQHTTPLFRCELCDEPTIKKKHCPQCGDVDDCPHEPDMYKIWDVPIKPLFENVTKNLSMQTYPDLIKGVRGTSNKSHIPEHLAKGILRAKNNIHVNKDGTTRYDASELTLTHFKPSEIRVPVEKLIQLGYERDVYGVELTSDDQILELKPQDVVLPCCDVPEYPDEACDEVLFRVANFVDELLEKLYKLPAFYNLQTPADLVGHQIIGLAPHTSAGMVGRIIGFSRTQGFFAHPLFHAAMRRDCDGDESCFLLLMDTFLNFSRKYLPESRGSTMDAPLVLTYWLNPSEVDDMAFNVDTPWKYPLEFYDACLAYKKPWDVKIERIEHFLDTPRQFEGMGYTHGTTDLNAGVLCSAYKVLPSMAEKLDGQLKLGKKIRAVDESDVARLVITKHFMRDTKGNLGKFSQQQFRCVSCNEKYRRPPLRGNCKVCNGRIIFTISEGSVVKYLEPSIRIAEEYNVSDYVKQDLELTKRRVEANFGRAAEKQEGLGKFIESN